MAAASDAERIKTGSRKLRGSLLESLADPLTGALADDDTQLSKFHGIYQQDDRDLRSERKRQRLEPAFSFMIRARVPGGRCTTAQWLNMDRIASAYANDTIRLTTRQAFQLHGVIKRELKQTVAAINDEMMDTLAACGDVNRNVMAPTLFDLTSVHRDVQSHARALSDHLTPATRAYHEIWLDGEKLETAESEPIYGETYLPRKFKDGLCDSAAKRHGCVRTGSWFYCDSRKRRAGRLQRHRRRRHGYVTRRAGDLPAPWLMYSASVVSTTISPLAKR